ncbi:MAG TPA: FtsX-like permease family protein [Candidatus Saccharimonadales bacterium]|nr:FtsX-like permease family protein [Candidatus Saccharimonadales bacterium]
MNPFSCGVRNAFRNSVRTGSIVLILGLSIGLSLTMLVAQKAVDTKIKSVKSSIGNTITISPAGFNPGSSANNALTTDQLTKVQKLTHVSSLSETLTDRQATAGSSTPSFGRFGDDTSSNTTTSLVSPTTLNTDGVGGRRFFLGGGGGGSLPTDFSLPVSFLGTNDPASIGGSAASITSGKLIDGTADTNNALISGAMATKNNLRVGSTFTAYNTTLTVAGIFRTDNQAARDTVVVSLPTLQGLSGQSGVVTGAIATVDSLDNLSGATTAIKSILGSSADVTSALAQADDTIAPLNSVRTVATFSLIGAVTAGAVIILLVMIMVVRERKREIGVVKAIGGSNVRIMSEFMVESLTLAVLGAVIGLFIGVVGGQPVTKMLVNNSTSSRSAVASAQLQGPGGQTFAMRRSDNGSAPIGGFGSRFGQGLRNNGAIRSLGNIKAQVGPGILLDGFGAAVLIAVLGSALSAGMIAKVRPSTVMRAD